MGSKYLNQLVYTYFSGIVLISQGIASVRYLAKLGG